MTPSFLNSCSGRRQGELSCRRSFQLVDSVDLFRVEHVEESRPLDLSSFAPDDNKALAQNIQTIIRF